MKRIWLAWSSGKDSAWALHILRRDPAVEVTGLLTTLNGAVDRVAMHGVRREILEAQAAAVGLPLLALHLPDPCSNDEYERVMRRAIDRARTEGITHVAFGDLFLQDVRSYREKQFAGTGIEPLFPIWGDQTDTPALARKMMEQGARAVITCIDTEQIPREFLGREFDEALLRDLPKAVDPCGERGEFHTLCHDGPAFQHSLTTVPGETVERGRFHYVDVLLAARPTAEPSAVLR